MTGRSHKSIRIVTTGKRCGGHDFLLLHAGSSGHRDTQMDRHIVLIVRHYLLKNSLIT